MTDHPAYEVLTAAEVETEFKVSGCIEYPYREFAGEQEQRVYRGGLKLAGDWCSEPGVDWNPYNVIVDGDLEIDGQLLWNDFGGGCYLLVTGDLKARNVVLQGCPNVTVLGELIAEGAIAGRYGDDGGVLNVGGRTRATLVLATSYFRMSFGPAVEATLIAAPFDVDMDVDFSADELPALVWPEFLDADGEADEGAMFKAMAQGLPVLRDDLPPGARAAAN